MTTLKLYGTVQDSIVDGPGLRYSVFVQGCSHACPGCHNPESQPTDAGEEHSVEEVLTDIRKNPLVRGVTLSGGEPFEQAKACAELAELLKKEGYDVWTYTGSLFEDLVSHGDEAVHRLIEHTDVLVDGPFVEKMKSIDCPWRGSTNQRLIDVKKTLDQGCVVEWTQDEPELEVPVNW